MEHILKVKVLTVSKNRLKKDLQIIKEESYFPHHELVLNDRETVQDVEKIAKTLAMQTIFIFKSPNRTICQLSW